MEGFFKRLIHRSRTLHVSILTLFLSLLIVAFALVISFTYTKNYQSILDTTSKDAEQITDLVLDRFQAIASNSERNVQSFSLFFHSIGDFSILNPVIKYYMLSLIEFDKEFSELYLGFTNGDSMGVKRISSSIQRTFLSDHSKPLPTDAVYGFNLVDASKQPLTDTWYYFDKQLNTIASETIPGSTYDPRIRPWYKGAMEKSGVYWTGVYMFYDLGEFGISVSTPFLDEANKPVGVIEADLTYTLLSQFLDAQTIGKTGKAFILNDKAEIVIPNVSPNEVFASGANTQLVKAFFKNRPSEEQSSSIMEDENGKDFIVFISPLPRIFGKHMHILILAPFSEFLGDVYKLHEEVMFMMFGILALASLIVIFFARRISAPIVKLADEVNHLRDLDLHSEMRIRSNIKEVRLMDEAVAAMRSALSSFAKYVPKDIVKELIRKGEEIALGGKKQEITIFFSDIAGFTTISENISIDQLVTLLAEYFDALSKIILSTNGTIDKFIGDGIMAIWGAPIEVADQQSKACIAALKCRMYLERLNQQRRDKGLPEFETRFGIHTGTVIVGNFGTEDRMNYTVIGDAVNTTSRLQTANKIYHTEILISEDLYEKVKNAYVARPIDFATVKGKIKAVKIFELMGSREGEQEILAGPEQIALSEAFSKAFDAFHREDYAAAKTGFENILKQYPTDVPAQLYLNRIQEHQH